MKKPYTYFIKHKMTGLFYYGVKYGKDANPETFWVDYFTSSKTVKLLIERDGKDSFDTEIRKVFKTPKEAYDWEQKVISKIINHELCLNASVGFSFDGNKNRHIKDKNGLSNYEKCSRKARITCLNDIDKNGYNTYQRNAHKIYAERDENYRINKSKKSAETMKANGIYEQTAHNHSIYQNEIMKSGLTRAKETGNKISKARKEMYKTGKLKKPCGKLNHAAIKVNIYDNNNILKFECHGDFQNVCKLNNLPVSQLKRSYKNNGEPYLLNKWNKPYFKEMYKGWYALKVPN